MAITSTASNSGTTSTLTPTLSFGFTASAGDLIIAIVGVDSAVTGITPGGSWVELNEGTHTGFRMGTYYLIASGGETGGSFTGSGTGDRWEAAYIRIPSGEWHGTTPPEQNTAVTGSSTSPDPGNISPSWGSETNNIFIAAFAGDDSANFSISSYPTNYDTAQVDASDTTSSANVGAAVRILTASSDNPGAFTISNTETWRSVGIAVRPASSGPQTVTLGFLDASSALYAPTLTPKNLISLGFLDAGSALYAPTLTPKNLISLGFLDASPALYAPTIANATSSADIILPLLESTPALYAPSLGFTLSLPLLDAGAALYAPTLTPKNLISLGFLDAGNALYAPTLTTRNTLILPLLDAGPALYAPTLTPKWAVSLPLLESTPALYAPTFATRNTLSLPLLDSGPALYAPVLGQFLQVSLPLLDAGAALYAPTVTSYVTLALPFLDAGAVLYAPTIERLNWTIALPLLDSAPALYSPTVSLAHDPAQALADAITLQAFFPRYRKVRDHKPL